jgi:glycosyltransferase involved in cell wall biosynthesis
MKLDIICNDGSPLQTHLADLYGGHGRIGLGGAECALHTLCEAWHNDGYDIRLYNDPINPELSPYQQFPLDNFNPQDDRDVLIIFRSPNIRADGAKGMKVFWSCDQFTCGNYKDFAPKVDKIVTISPFHAQYFQTRYGISDTITIDLPVREWDYLEKVEKIPHRLVFCSVPDRGLDVLADVFDEIVKAVPDVSLTITSDYRLWGSSAPLNERHVARFLGNESVRFLGAIPRMDMVKEQQQAEILAYPCTYEELFCYAVAECSVAGAYPITSNEGAVETTNMGTQIDGSILHDKSWKDRFTYTVIDYLVDPFLRVKQKELQRKALERFSIDRILQEWNTRVFGNG